MDEFGFAGVSPTRARLVQDFAGSELFERVFQEGMELVEETAAYLDGAGRQESKQLSKGLALAYAGESMRLTTRLMQLASWLLVQRAVREGDMAASEACQPRYRFNPEVATPGEEPSRGMPDGLVSLCERAERLYERVSHLDRRMYADADPDVPNAVLSQLERVRSAFGMAS